MNYGKAFTAAKGGSRVARVDWGGKYLTFEDGSVEFGLKPVMMLNSADDSIVWQFTPEDLEATDWIFVG
jgi:Protein of unknown function (DUF2829)